MSTLQIIVIAGVVLCTAAAFGGFWVFLCVMNHKRARQLAAMTPEQRAEDERVQRSLNVW